MATATYRVTAPTAEVAAGWQNITGDLRVAAKFGAEEYQKMQTLGLLGPRADTNRPRQLVPQTNPRRAK